ncbi:MAG: hypothetical protein LUG89_04800, partial [Methanosphaera sp.]|nr:hypothetical protein [Methanosphaera sp.]
ISNAGNVTITNSTLDIYNLTLNNVTISNSYKGISNAGNVTITNSTLDIYNLTLNNVTISNSYKGISNAGNVTITNSTLDIYNIGIINQEGNVTVTDSSFYNSVIAIDNDGNLVVTDSIFNGTEIAIINNGVATIDGNIFKDNDIALWTNNVPLYYNFTNNVISNYLGTIYAGYITPLNAGIQDDSLETIALEPVITVTSGTVSEDVDAYIIEGQLLGLYDFGTAGDYTVTYSLSPLYTTNIMTSTVSIIKRDTIVNITTTAPETASDDTTITAELDEIRTDENTEVNVVDEAPYIGTTITTDVDGDTTIITITTIVANDNGTFTNTTEILTITTTPINDANVTLTVNDVEYKATTVDGVATFENVVIPAGNSTVTVTYDGNGTYAGSTDSVAYEDVSVLDAIITVDAINNTVAKDTVTVTGTVTTNESVALENKTVEITLDNAIYTAVTDGNGVYAVNVTAIAGENVVVVSLKDDVYAAESVNTTFNVTPLTTTITTSNVSGAYLDDVVIVANVVDENGDAVTSGEVIFKLNGVTIKDADNNPVYAEVVDGVAQITYTLSNTPKDYNLTATYLGDEYYVNSTTEEVSTLTVNKQNATIDIADYTTSFKSGDTVVITVTVTDANGLINDGVVSFKINGVTLKDENNETIVASVVNGIATLEYTIPVDMGAKEYTITAVYSGKGYNRVEDNTTFNIVKSDVIANIDPIYITQGENATITMTLYDQNNNQLERSTKYTVKVNGKTYVNKALTENGVLSVTLDTDDFTNTYYNITVILGENSAYNTKTLQTILIVNESTDDDETVLDETITTVE